MRPGVVPEDSVDNDISPRKTQTARSHPTAYTFSIAPLLYHDVPLSCPPAQQSACHLPREALRSGVRCMRVEEQFVIRQAFRNGMSPSEIAQVSGHGRKTINPIVTAEGPRRPRERAREKCLDPFKDYIQGRLCQGVSNSSPNRATAMNGTSSFNGRCRPAACRSAAPPKAASAGAAGWAHFQQ